jgi:hypothetical protein
MNHSSVVRYAVWILVLLTDASVLMHRALAQTPNLSNNGAVIQGAIITTFPYSSWFVSRKHDATSDLVIRKFSYEVIARNIFVLVCTKDPARPVTVELIPPKSLEAVLRGRAGETLKPTAVMIEDTNNPKNSFPDVTVYQGLYDNVAAFVVLRIEQLKPFLEMVGRTMVRMTLQEPRIQYLMWDNEPNKQTFRQGFPHLFDKAQYDEMSWQDALVRCQKFTAQAG